MNLERSVRLFTEPEAAKTLNLCSQTLRRARQAGKLPYILVGRSIRYTIEDLETFIDNSRQDNSCNQPPVVNKTRRNSGRSAKIIPFSARNR